jgi:hypothetical protein
MSVKTVYISGKVSDLFHGTLFDEDMQILEEVDGYVPAISAIDGPGDYIGIQIDNATGTIVGWKPIETFKSE